MSILNSFPARYRSRPVSATIATISPAGRVELLKAIRRIYPGMPERDAMEAVRFAMCPGHVGHDLGKDIAERAKLAVRARARHAYTSYDRTLAAYLSGSCDGEEAKRKARQAIDATVNALVIGWRWNYRTAGAAEIAA